LQLCPRRIVLNYRNNAHLSSLRQNATFFVSQIVGAPSVTFKLTVGIALVGRQAHIWRNRRTFLDSLMIPTTTFSPFSLSARAPFCLFFGV
jgi:hypothetical protein